MTLRPHSPAWYDRLATLQDGYFFPWKSILSPYNGEDAYLTLLNQHLNPDLDVLDVGCGHGEVSISIASRCRRILAYDRVERYIQIAQTTAKNHGFSNIIFRCADSSADKNAGRVYIPAENNVFDLLISRRGPLHWLADARRVARPGAVIIQLNPLETPIPTWAEHLPEPLRSAAGIDYKYGMLNSVKYGLKEGDLMLHSAFTYDVPEIFDDPYEVYIRLSWGYLPNEVPSWYEIRTLMENIFIEFAGPTGLVMRHTRLLWKAVVD
jgi:SAM-dependent methyltransferase